MFRNKTIETKYDVYCFLVSFKIEFPCKKYDANFHFLVDGIVHNMKSDPKCDMYMADKLNNLNFSNFVIACCSTRR